LLPTSFHIPQATVADGNHLERIRESEAVTPGCSGSRGQLSQPALSAYKSVACEKQSRNILPSQRPLAIRVRGMQKTFATSSSSSFWCLIQATHRFHPKDRSAVDRPRLSKS